MLDRGSAWSWKLGAFIDLLVYGLVLILFQSYCDMTVDVFIFLLSISSAASITGVFIALRIRLWHTQPLPVGLILWTCHGIAALVGLTTVMTIPAESAPDSWDNFGLFVRITKLVFLLQGGVAACAAVRQFSSKFQIEKGYDQIGTVFCFAYAVVVVAPFGLLLTW